MIENRLKFQKRRLGWTIAAYTIVPALLVSLCAFAFSFHVLDTKLVQDGEGEVIRMAEKYRQLVQQNFGSALLAMRLLASRHTRIGEFTQGELTAVAGTLKRSVSWVDGLAVIDGSGTPLIMTGRLDAAYFKGMAAPLLSLARSQREILVTDIRVAADGTLRFLIAMAQPYGDTAGFVCIAADARAFSALLDKARFGRTGEIFLINEKGVLQTRSVLHGAIRDAVDVELSRTVPRERTVLRREWRGARLWFSMLPVAGIPGWRLVVQGDEREILQARDEHANRLVLLAVTGLGILCAAAAGAYGRIRKLQNSLEGEQARFAECSVQVRKLDAISQLGAGIAHEVNNPLAIIGEEVGWMQDVLKRASFGENPDAGELRDCLRQIVTQTGRCREITHKLLSFGGKTDGTIRDVDLNVVVRDVATLKRREAAQKNIEIDDECAARLPIVMSEPALLRQLLICLINNAMDSMPEGGRIVLSTEACSDRGALFRVRDTGFGIPEENMDKIFDPFFTTKPPGKGAGLGLSICHGILERISGRVFVDSAPGEGTTVTVELPPQPRSGAGRKGE